MREVPVPRHRLGSAGMRNGVLCLIAAIIHDKWPGAQGFCLTNGDGSRIAQA